MFIFNITGPHCRNRFMNRWQNSPVMFCIFFSLLEILHHTAVKQDFLASLPNLPFLLAQHLTLKLCIFPSNVPVSFLSHPVFNHGHSLPPLALSNYRISHGFFICLFLTGLFFSSYFFFAYFFFAFLVCLPSIRTSSIQSSSFSVYQKCPFPQQTWLGFSLHFLVIFQSLYTFCLFLLLLYRLPRFRQTDLK